MTARIRSKSVRVKEAGVEVDDRQAICELHCDKGGWYTLASAKCGSPQPYHCSLLTFVRQTTIEAASVR